MQLGFDFNAEQREREEARLRWTRRWLQGRVQGPPQWLYLAWLNNLRGLPVPERPPNFFEH